MHLAVAFPTAGVPVIAVVALVLVLVLIVVAIVATSLVRAFAERGHDRGAVRQRGMDLGVDQVARHLRPGEDAQESLRREAGADPQRVARAAVVPVRVVVVSAVLAANDAAAITVIVIIIV